MVVGHSGSRMRSRNKFLGIIGVCGFAAAIILAGAGRPVQAVPVPERYLAGIKIFSPSDEVLKKFGTPDEVRIGSDVTSLLTDGIVNNGGGAASANGANDQGGGPGGYPGQGGGPGGYPGQNGGPGGYPGQNGGPGGYPGQNGGPGGYPGQGGGPGQRRNGGYPGSPNNQNNQNGANGANGADTGDSNVEWVYDRPDGTSLEFTLSPTGRVIQIHLSGFKSVYRTARGIGLGASYSTVATKYGFPESQNITGRVLNMNYIQKFHAAFQFLNQKLVGIIVAAVD